MPASRLRNFCRLWPALFTASCAHNPVISEQTARVEKAYAEVSRVERNFNPATHKATWEEEQKHPFYTLWMPHTDTEKGEVDRGLRVLVNNGEQKRAARTLARLARQHGVNEAYLEQAPHYQLPVPSELRETNPYLSWKYGAAARQ